MPLDSVRGADYRAPSTRTAPGCCDKLVPIEVMPAGVRRRRRRHRRVQHVAVARADRACAAYAARSVRARETVGDDAPRFFKKRCCLVLAREMMLRGVNVEREKNCASRRCRCCCAGIRSVDLEFRQRYRSSTRDRSRSQTPIPPESARDRRVVWKQKKRSLSLRILRL